MRFLPAGMRPFVRDLPVLVARATVWCKRLTCLPLRQFPGAQEKFETDATAAISRAEHG